MTASPRSLERTVIDLAGGLDRTTRISLVDDVRCADGTTRHRLHLRAKALSTGRAGVAHVAELTHPASAELFRSWLERHAAACFLEAGLPPAKWDVELWDEHGRIGVADCVFAGGEVVVELDGLRYHSSPAQRRRDNQKDRRVALSRRICLRYTWLDLVRRPEAVVAEIREAIASVEDGALTR